MDRVLELDAKWREGGLDRGICSTDWLPHQSLLATAHSLLEAWHFQADLHGVLCMLWPAERGQLDTLNMDFNKLNREIGTLRKVGWPAAA